MSMARKRLLDLAATSPDYPLSRTAYKELLYSMPGSIALDKGIHEMS